MNSHFFKANRTKLKSLTKSKLIILSANVLIQKSLDQAYPFKQDNNFWYLTGVNEPGFILVIAGSEEYLIAPSQSEIQATFDGKFALEDICKTSGIRQILNQKQGWQKTAKLISSSKSVATMVPKSGYSRRFGIYPTPARQLLIRRLRKLKPTITLENVTPMLAELRMVKSQAEIESVKKAVDITCQTLNEALDPSSLNSLTTTNQLEAVINFGMMTRGADDPSFDPIIAQGRAANIIHYSKNDQKLNNQELLLLDVGCSWSNYSSDIARTVSLSSPTPRQQEVFNSVKEVQDAVIKQIKSGLLLADLQKLTDSLIGEQLIKLKLIKKIDKQSIRRYYPYSIAHSLGLDVHDLADYSKPMPVNSIIAVEPGIHIVEENIGVRLEDNVLVSKNGAKVLSGSLPRRL